jgi:hypothetical protein
MAVYDGYQGRKKGQVNANNFTRQDVSDTRPRRDASPVSVSSGTSPRTRASVAASGIESDVPEQKIYRLSLGGNGYIDYSPEEYERYLRLKKEREERARAEANRRAEAERARVAHVAEEERRAEMLRQAATVKTMLQIQLSKQLESKLVIGEIENTMSAYGATLEETQAVGASLAKEGCTELPSMWESRLLELRRKL